ncbi:MAG: molybdopterin-dependent oxidoreductase [Deltaproteobacteria bacterium]|nr:MAG: molybdopterin-dependent oxidoreductase [Deltaproteobacteria bacterium]
MAEKNREKEVIIPTMCASHCGGTCLLRVHVKDGVITRVETDDGEEPQLRACMRGRALRQRVYAPNRVLYPMKRKGERGEGKFERISWDEALDKVAAELKRVRENYGPKSILFLPMAGDLGSLHSIMTIDRLLSLAGGYTTWWGTTSFHGGVFASFLTYGTVFCSNTRNDLPNSRLIIMWGWNPAITQTGTNTAWFLARAKEGGTRIIAVDPCYGDTAAAFAEEWIPIKPGTDAAMAIAMAYVMIQENLHDQKFLDTYTVGFDKFREYVLGSEDGVAKTPTWAEAITGMPTATIERLARDYATTKPAALMSGIAPGRTTYGEQFHRATITLAAMTGNVGRSGGDAGARAWESILGGYPYKAMGLGAAIPFTFNPVEDLTKSDGVILGYTYPKIHYTRVADAILKGKAGGYPADYKMAFIVNCDYLNSLPNINKSVKALKELEFVVVEEQFMNTTARYADIILPTSTFVEREDIVFGVGMAYCGPQRKIIEPIVESKPHNDIAKALAVKMGIDNYDEETEEDRLKQLADMVDIPDYELFKEKGVHWIERSEPYVAFKQQIEDPKKHPFTTPSGKIEIYSQQIADINNPLIPPIPKYLEAWEGPNDPLAKKYPVQLITNHCKRRSNSQFDTFPWLRELVPQVISISVKDAEFRGIKDGDMVRVFNDRGETVLPARVTQRILPGVANLPEGAWYNPDEKGIDRAGSANILTRDEPSPAGSFPYNSVLVQIEKVEGVK